MGVFRRLLFLHCYNGTNYQSVSLGLSCKLLKRGIEAKSLSSCGLNFFVEECENLGIGIGSRGRTLDHGSLGHEFKSHKEPNFVEVLSIDYLVLDILPSSYLDLLTCWVGNSYR